MARMIRSHWTNIMTCFDHRITNAGAESINSKIRKVNYMSRGFRNREHFRNTIYFHCGGRVAAPAGHCRRYTSDGGSRCQQRMN